MDVGDQPTEEQSADLAIRGDAVLELVEARARDAGNPTGHPFGVAQVAQVFGDLAPPFGLMGSSPLKSALAALTASSSASSSAMVL